MAEYKLTPEQEDLAFDLILNTEKQANIARQLGFKNRTAYQKYIVNNPDFFELCERARAAACWFLEDQLLFVADDYDGKVARTKMDCIAKILAYRDPKRYGNKMDLNVTQTIDISGALDRAERRVIDVTAPGNVVSITGKKT